MKKVGVFCLILVLVLALGVYGVEDEQIEENPQEEVLPGFDIAKSVNWIKEKSAEEKLSMEEISFAILALNNHGEQERVQKLVTRLNDFQSEEGCFPKQKCTTKETALAALALGKTGNDVSKSVEWLKTQLTPGLKRGEWRLQINAGGEGECDVSHSTRGEAPRERKFQMKDNKLIGTSSPYFINIGTELSGALVNSIINPVLNVDCHLQSPIITLIYKEGNNIYLVKNKPGVAENMVMPNACFTPGRGKACDYESTLYSAWALKELGENLEDYGVNVYLETEQNLNEVNQALLARIFKKTLYYDMLVKSQKEKGFWGDRNTFATALAVFSLKEITQDVYSGAAQGGEEFLKQSVYKDGDWFGKVKDTSMAVIALTGSDLLRGAVSPLDLRIGGSDVENCENGVDDDGDTLVDCRDFDECQSHPACSCENEVQDPGEEGIDCGGSCRNSCDDESGVVDREEEISEEFEDFETGVEDLGDEGEDVVDEEGGSGLLWIALVLVVLIVGGGVFYLVKSGKIKLKGGKKPSFEDFKSQYQTSSRPSRPAFSQPARQAAPAARKPASKVSKDDALAKSLKEAEELLGK